MAIETLRGDSSTTYVRVITDADAVYGVTDANARERGDHLALVGATGQQGVVTSAGSDLLVVESSTAEDETLVTILPEAHHALLEGEGRVRPVGGELNAAIARAVVRYQRVQTGRGPTRAQAFYRGEVVVVVLEEMMSKAERSLLEHGRIDAVRHMREAFQEASRDDLVAIVESLTGARVRSFMSANDLARDVSVEVFLLDNPIWSE